MSQADQDQEQGQLAQPSLAQRGGQAQGIGEVLQDLEQAEDGTELRRGDRGRIEVAAQGAAEGLDARGGPMGEIGEGAIFDFAVLAEGFAEEDSGGRVAVGDGGDVHADYIQQ